MCYERGLAALNLEEDNKVAQVEFLQNTDFIAEVSGLDPLKHPEAALSKTYEKLDLDMIWFTHDPLNPWDFARLMGEKFLADGFIIEECCNLEHIAEKYGNSHVIIGGIDISVLTYGNISSVIKEVRRCLRAAGPYPGYFLNVSGSIPDNVPIMNLKTYFEVTNKYRRRPFRG